MRARSPSCASPSNANASAYFRAQLDARPTLVFAWLATVDTTVVASAALTIATRYFSRWVAAMPSTTGSAASTWIRTCGVSRLTLGASPDGKPMYEKLGFVRNDDEMVFAPRG